MANGLWGSLRQLVQIQARLPRRKGRVLVRVFFFVWYEWSKGIEKQAELEMLAVALSRARDLCWACVCTCVYVCVRVCVGTHDGYVTGLARVLLVLSLFGPVRCVPSVGVDFNEDSA